MCSSHDCHVRWEGGCFKSDFWVVWNDRLCSNYVNVTIKRYAWDMNALVIDKGNQVSNYFKVSFLVKTHMKGMQNV